MAAQMSLMQQQLSQIVSAINPLTKICELCGGAHSSQECQVGNPFAQPEQVNYMNNYQRGPGNSYGQYNQNQYNPNWRNNHPNLSWSNTSNTLQPQQNLNAPEKKMTMEDMFSKLMVEIKKGNERTFDNEMQIKNQNATIKNIEMQLGQIHNTLSQRPQGAFPSDTEKNPRAQANAITLRSGKQYDEPQQVFKPAETAQEKKAPAKVGKDGEEEEAQLRE